MLLEGVRLETGEEEEEEGEEEGAKPPGPQGPIRVSVELQYKLGERTETHLQEMGARCVEEASLTDLYYDTESFQLAAQQTWLSRQGAQWRLILDQGPHPSVDSLGLQAETGSGAEQTAAGGEVGAERGGGAEGSAVSLRGSPFPKPTGLSEAPGGPNILPRSPPLAPRYRELTASSSIVEHLARCLQVELPEEEGDSMSVERFVELAGVQNYGSWTVSKRLEYRLPGTCTLEVRRDYSGGLRTHTAILTMGADVLNIGRELDRMESVAAELDLQPRHSRLTDQHLDPVSH